MLLAFPGAGPPVQFDLFFVLYNFIISVPYHLDSLSLRGRVHPPSYVFTMDRLHPHSLFCITKRDGSHHTLPFNARMTRTLYTFYLFSCTPIEHPPFNC